MQQVKSRQRRQWLNKHSGVSRISKAKLNRRKLLCLLLDVLRRPAKKNANEAELPSFPHLSFDAAPMFE